jgi:hypothetical protein
MPTINQKTPPSADKYRLIGIILKAVHPAPTKIQTVPAHFRYQLRPFDGVRVTGIYTI